MLHLSPLYRIDQGFNNWGVEMYRFGQFCLRFSVLDDFSYGFAISNGPQCPLATHLSPTPRKETRKSAVYQLARTCTQERP